MGSSEPEDEDSKAEALRQALEADKEKLNYILDQTTSPTAKALADAARAAADSPATKYLEAMTQTGPAIEAARQMIQKMAPGMEAINTMAQHMKELNAQVAGAMGQRLKEEAILPSSINFRALKSREDYILEAQRDAVEAIIGVSALQQQALVVMGTQVEVLEKVQKDAAKQTKLSWLLIGIAFATLVVSLILALVSQ